MTYEEALAKIREDADAETKTGLQAIDPLDHDAMLDLILDLVARVTAAEKREAQRVAEIADPANHPARNLAFLSRKAPDGSWEPT